MEGSWSASVAARGLRRAGSWWGGAWSASLAGRALLWLGLTLGRLAGGSLLLSLAGSGPRPLRSDDPALGFVGSLLARVYEVLRRWLGAGAVGRTSRRLGRGAAGSVLAEGGWVAVLGAAFAGIGAGGLIAGRPGPTGWIVLLVAGTVASLGAAAALRPPGARLWGQVRRPLPALLLSAFVAALFAGMVPDVTLQVVVIAAVPVGVVACAYRPELLLLVPACFPWVDWLARNAVGGPLGAAWDELLIVGSFAALAVAVLVTCRWRLATIPQAVPMLAVGVAAVASVAINDVGPETGLFALRVTVQPLLFFLVGYLLPRDARLLRWVVAFFLAASALLALHGLYQYATHAPMPATWVDVRETAIGTRSYSVIGNPNGLGAYLLLGTLLGLALALGRLSTLQRLVAAAVTAVLAAGLAVTFSRGSWVGLVAGLLALTALAHRRLLGGLVAGSVLAVLFAPRAFVDRLTFAVSSEYINKSLSAGRLYIWQVAYYRMAEHPWFGLGLGTFGGSTAFIFGFSRLWIDNFYVQLAAEGGLLLLAAFAWLLLRTLKGQVAAHVRARDPFLRALTAGGFAAFVAVCVANLTAGVWETVAVGAGSWFLAGLTASTVEAHVTPLPRVGDMPVDLAPAGGADQSEARRGADPTETGARP